MRIAPETNDSETNQAPRSYPLLAAQLTRGIDHVDPQEFAGGIRPEMASLPHIRLGKKWVTTSQILKVLIPLGFIAGLCAVAVAQQLRTIPEVQAFVRTYPGTGSFSQPVESGFPWWLRYQHYLNLLFMLFIIRSGLQILADHPRLYLDGNCTPGRSWFRLRGPVPTDRIWTSKDDSVTLPGWLGLPGIRHSIGLARWWHFSLDTLWLLNGVLFYVLLFSTDQWMRLVPQSWDIVPNAASTAIQYASLDFPPRSGWLQYNALQMMAYFTTVFVAAPLAIITGLLQSPAIAARFKTQSGPLNRQVARTIHFAVLGYFILFIIVHITMVFCTGLVQNLNHITRGVNDNSYGGVALFMIGIALIVAAWLLATPLTLRYPRLVQHGGRLITGWVRELLERAEPVAQYEEKDISPYFWLNGNLPDSDEYRLHLVESFQNYKLKVSGLVENPVELSLAELQAMPRSEQITQHYCIQGWSAIARWGGVQVSEIMKIVRPRPEVRYVVFYSFAHGAGKDAGLYYDVHELAHMHHANSILAYEMNGERLSESHGAPLRLRNELELGFKQVKWVQAVEFVQTFRHLGSGEGGFNEDNEYYGYRAPI
jgi:DMSO/TMAO reductase YedYZ molybdopterin-dependent catalytic subunit/thiosulfate reductase cytochrome b subunit